MSNESYKYLGILPADKFLQEKIKLNVSKEYKVKKSFEVKSERWEFNSGSKYLGSILIQQHFLVGGKVNSKL